MVLPCLFCLVKPFIGGGEPMIKAKMSLDLTLSIPIAMIRLVDKANHYYLIKSMIYGMGCSMSIRHLWMSRISYRCFYRQMVESDVAKYSL